ncbi:MAG: Redoxin domain protein [Marmoricola sp.]|nr:Redoxin domain protein [Marmoricola sp.]
MRRRARGIVLLVVLLATVLAGCGRDLDEPGAAQSDRLPDVTLSGINDTPAVDLGALKGPAVVNLWASWCAPCRKELPLYADFARAYAGKIDVLGVDFQETSDQGARDLMAKAKVGYPVVLDPDGDTGAIGLPKIILIGADGKIAHQEYVEIKSAQQLEDLVAEHLGVRR